MISVGIMSMSKYGLRPVRGKTVPLREEPQWSSERLTAAATTKLKDSSPDVEDGEYVLLYPDGSQIENIPGTDSAFTVERYKKATGKSYQRITVYICPLEDVLSESRKYCRRTKDGLSRSADFNGFYNKSTSMCAPVTTDSCSSDSEEEETKRKKRCTVQNDLSE